MPSRSTERLSLIIYKPAHLMDTEFVDTNLTGMTYVSLSLRMDSLIQLPLLPVYLPLKESFLIFSIINQNIQN